MSRNGARARVGSRRRRYTVGPRPRSCATRRRELVVVGEDLLLELAKLGARLDAQFVE
jgi:hypothetical protein